jgi:hypothetical protein
VGPFETAHTGQHEVQERDIDVGRGPTERCLPVSGFDHVGAFDDQHPLLSA